MESYEEVQTYRRCEQKKAQEGFWEEGVKLNLNHILGNCARVAGKGELPSTWEVISQRKCHQT